MSTENCSHVHTNEQRKDVWGGTPATWHQCQTIPNCFTHTSIPRQSNGFPVIRQQFLIFVGGNYEGPKPWSSHFPWSFSVHFVVGDLINIDHVYIYIYIYIININYKIQVMYMIISIYIYIERVCVVTCIYIYICTSSVQVVRTKPRHYLLPLLAQLWADYLLHRCTVQDIHSCETVTNGGLKKVLEHLKLSL